MAARTAQEFQAGRTASTDLLAGYADHIRAVTQVGGIEAVDWRAWAPNLQDPADLRQRDGGRLPVEHARHHLQHHPPERRGGAAVATGLAQAGVQGAHRLDALCRASFDQISVPEVWGQQRTLEFTRGLAAQSAG